MEPRFFRDRTLTFKWKFISLLHFANLYLGNFSKIEWFCNVIDVCAIVLAKKIWVKAISRDISDNAPYSYRSNDQLLIFF